MIYDYDFINKIIDIPAIYDTVLVLDLLTDIREAEATRQGIAYGQIASASGGEGLGGTVYVGITLELLDDWQIRFAAGNYIARVTGGNLVGGLGGDPVAYSSGVQVLLVQSAASTMVVSASGLTVAQEALLQTAATESTKGRKMQTNKAIISGDELTVTIYDDDGASVLHTFDVAADKLTRTPA